MIRPRAALLCRQRWRHRGGEAIATTGADPNAFDDLGWTPLIHAAKRGHLAVVACLLTAGAEVDARDEARAGNTALREVAAECSLEMAKALIDAGADPRIPGWMQITALDQAKKRKRGDGPAVYRLLLDAAEKAWRAEKDQSAFR